MHVYHLSRLVEDHRRISLFHVRGMVLLRFVVFVFTLCAFVFLCVCVCVFVWCVVACLCGVLCVGMCMYACMYVCMCCVKEKAV